MRIAYTLEPAELEWSAVRAQGAGGQNVNKVSNAAHLRFDIGSSSLPAALKARLRALPDTRISEAGVIVIKAQAHRTQDRNRAEALARLVALVARAADAPKPRRATRPTYASKLKRLDTKTRRGDVKALRGKVEDD